MPALLQEIMNVEHLWFSGKSPAPAPPPDTEPLSNTTVTRSVKHLLLSLNHLALGSCLSSLVSFHLQSSSLSFSFRLTTCLLFRMADQRLYKLVKWCKSLPLFKNIMVSVS